MTSKRKRSGPGSVPEALVERDAQLAQVAEACHRVADGRGELLVIEGPAGIGKTAVLHAGVAMAAKRGFLVLTARGDQLETEFAFGIVRQLFDRHLASLSAAERTAAFAGAAGLAAPLVTTWTAQPLEASSAPGQAESRFSALHGIYWLTANLAESRPLLLAVDDAHLGDLPSLHFLAYLARRLEHVRVLVLSAARPSANDEASGTVAEIVDAGPAHIVTLRPLSVEAVDTLVKTALGGPVEKAFSAACHRASGGNPFILRELVAALQASSIAPTAASTERVAALRPATVARSALVRLARLGGPAGDLARALALLGGGQLRLAAKLAGLEPGGAATATAVDALVAAEFLRAERPVEFVHPLLRDAAYQSIPPAKRAHMHARAARLLAAENVASEVVAAHLLESEPAGQAWVVETLRSVASAALSRGAPEPALIYLRRALSEPPSRKLGGEVFTELAIAASAAQASTAVADLNAALQVVREVRTRCQLAMLLARQLMHQHRLGETVDLLERTIGDLPNDEENRDLALRLESELIMMMHFDLSLHAASWQRLDRLDPEAEPDGLGKTMLLANLAGRAVFVGEPLQHTVGIAARAVADWRAIVEADAGSALLAPALRTLVWSDQLERADKLYAEVLTDALEHGRIATYSLMSAFRSECAFRRGEVGDAETYAREATEAAAAHGITMGVAYGAAFLALALIEQGRLDEAGDALAELPVGDLPLHLAFNPALYAQGLLRQARGDDRGALADLLACGERQLAWGCLNPAVLPWRSRAALAHEAVGEHDLAVALAADELTLARRFGAPTAIAISLRVAGLLERGERSTTLLAEAATLLEESSTRLELAYALVDYGARLRRVGSRTEAREPLRRGLDLASRCGATTLRARARRADHGRCPPAPGTPDRDGRSHRERVASRAARRAGNDQPSDRPAPVPKHEDSRGPPHTLLPEAGNRSAGGTVAGARRSRARVGRQKSIRFKLPSDRHGGAHPEPVGQRSHRGWPEALEPVPASRDCGEGDLSSSKRCPVNPHRAVRLGQRPGSLGAQPALRCSSIVLYSLAYVVVRLLLEILIVRGGSAARLCIEVLALRHRLGVLERQVGRARWQASDRLVLAAISRILPKTAERSLLPRPETLLRWHRELVRHKWAAYRRRPRRQPAVPVSELHELILRIARGNPRWGYRRIQGELRKLGHRCSHLTVRKVLRRHGLPPAPRRGQRSWREFVRQHADQVLAVDFFTVNTVWLARLYVLFFIEVGSRRVHLAGCTYIRPAPGWFSKLGTWPGNSRTVSW